MRRKGFTLAELMIALVVFSIVVGTAIIAMRSQSQGFSRGSDRMRLLQNVRYVVGMLDQELRTVGAGVPDRQPYLVYADAATLVFNANITSNLTNDITAVYIDPDAPAGTVSALGQSTQITFPGTGITYPDTNYTAGPSNSPAETIVFFFRPDSSTVRTDDYGLFRQVNQETPSLVARNLLQVGTTPFFEYTRVMVGVGGVLALQTVPGAQLPLRHTAPMHGAAADTGLAAIVDSLRGVRVTVRATNGQSGAEERTRELSRIIRFPNAGLASPKTCGDAPLAVIGFTAVGVTSGGGSPAVNLAWPQAVDEGGGEMDAMRYVIWRRASTNPAWGDPLLSIPVGNPTYLYQDLQVNSADILMYAVAVQDCTPALSPMATAGPVVVP